MIRINFLHWRGVIRRGVIRSTGRSLWSYKEFRWSRISITAAAWSLEAKVSCLSLVLIFPYFLRLVVQIEVDILFTRGRAKSKYGGV